jgi:hypothetical protein
MRLPLVRALPLSLVTIVVASAAIAACGSSDNGSEFDAGAPPQGDGGSDVTLGSDAPPADVGPVVRDDFPTPIFDTGAPPNAGQLFLQDAGAQSSGGPCLYEPELGSLFPNNWLRPRFRFNAAHQENLFEITLVVPNEKHPLVIYTTKSGYTLDKAAWASLTTFAAGAGPIHVTVRSAVVTNGALTAGPWLGSEGDVEIAPVAANGTVVYWTTSGGTVLKGFKIGDESVQSIITPTQAGTACVACHTSTPDGKYVALTASDDVNDGSKGYIRFRSVDGTFAEPPFLSASAKSLLARVPQHAPAFSKAHWQAGDHTALSMMGVAGKMEIVWTDLEAASTAEGTGWGVLARTGDGNAASAAAFSHDGQKVVYTSSTGSGAGTITSDGQLFTVPYGNRAGGAASPVTGANDPQYHHYYPTFSADDRWLAMNRVANTETSYNDAKAEVFVVPSAGGAASRLAANSPPQCLGVTSPGVTNSWPKWSPEVKSAGGKDYYFLVFSSTRNAATNGPQLYVAPMVVSGSTVKTYAALYLWNQPETEHNHTPAWDVFQIPPPK